MESDLVPSANLICTEVTGWLVSMLTDGVGVGPVGVAWDAEAVDWTTSGVILVKKIEREEERRRGMSYFPSFWPAPENGTSFGFFWTKSSFLLSSILISTSPPLASLLNSCGISLQVNTSSSLLQYSVTQQHCCDKTYWLTASLSLLPFTNWM